MESARLEYVRKRLEARVAELHAALERSADQTSAVAPDAAIGRLTRVDAVQAGFVSEALRRQMSADLAAVQRALARIGDGTFGVCLRCGEDLPAARLEAKPEATLCVACADRR